MNRDDIIRMAKEAEIVLSDGFSSEPETIYYLKLSNFEKFAALVAAHEREAMIKAGWRQCAEGQRTTQFCALLEEAVAKEREACAIACESIARDTYGMKNLREYGECAAAIRARGME